ncbi:MAG: hypothetical protein RL318_2157 [Fibrobacterota bacterium]
MACACTPIDPPGDDTSTVLTAGTYVPDLSVPYGHSSHEEWTFSNTGALSIRHFRWDATTEIGCYDSHSDDNTWSSHDGRLYLNLGLTLQVRSACDSAWRDTVNVQTGPRNWRLRSDSVGVDYFDSSDGRWHTFRRI